MREVLHARLSQWGHDVRTADSGAAARAYVDALDPEVVISDVVLPDLNGVELLHTLKVDRPDRVVLLITAYGSIGTAVDAMRRGAADFLTKPLDYNALRERLAEVMRDRDARARAAAAAAAPAAPTAPEGAAPEPERLGPLVGASASQRALWELVRRVADSDATALIIGESGTGKELVARTIHDLSARSKGPFVPVNAAAIPEGLTDSLLLGHMKGAFTGATDTGVGMFQLAHGGTLFLDEITEMPIALQAKLLRVLEDGVVRPVGSTRELRFDVRVIAATNRDPMVAVEERHLRQDLLFRLDVLRVTIDPLRKRREDIPVLARHFIALSNQRHGATVTGLSDDALTALAAHDFPGNVREMRNLIERAVVFAREGLISARHLPFGEPEPQRSPPPTGIVLPEGVTSAEAERILIMETLRRTGNNKAEAARRLGIDVKTLRNKLKIFGS
ncbi:two component, sigma54 specific, transcriptional regulator, Fis family [Chondromyces apiculatus DSM 436]|uniref:Two component, sigma54 specific, transcriptional regulator, Fis family n=2 Tax=Chondromyces apiculatus TaxID=51 RepID=A0A017T4L5_9BACT|nr:two component, sigma54 specific, transcriptional regulator, Fis family [Chondromyces apiculatus DSM 436]